MNTYSTELDGILIWLVTSHTGKPLSDRNINHKTLEVAKVQILSRYRLVEDIKKAVPKPKASFHPSDAQNSYELGWNECRQKILATLKIGEENE